MCRVASFPIEKPTSSTIISYYTEVMLYIDSVHVDAAVYVHSVSCTLKLI